MSCGVFAFCIGVEFFEATNVYGSIIDMERNMRISKMIIQLQEAMKVYGDLHVTTYAGNVGELKMSPSKDGILNRDEPNEISMEIIQRWSGK